jgi:UDP-glucose:(heptosyl)LPS alpha-1,3-glucosyltransferase
MSLRIAVVSPFVDKRHGTERCLAEEIERLARVYGCEIHLYSQRVEDLHLGSWSSIAAGITWHKVPGIPGPQLLKYFWWFAVNHLWRWWDCHVRNLRFDLVYSPGINCLDADVITVHVVFANLCRQMREAAGLESHSVGTWARLAHRWFYYRLIRLLERLVYRRRSVALVAVSRKTAQDVARFYGHGERVTVVYHGVGVEQFNPERRRQLRSEARRQLGLAENAFALLLIGTDWKRKGLPCLLEAAGRLQKKNLRILVVGHDDPSAYRELISDHSLDERVRFLPPRSDVEFYYAAADAYVGPSLEDAFALPPAEAMACGLPVIVSNQAGVSELVADWIDGLVLRDPRDADELARKIQHLYYDAELRARLERRAAQKIRSFTWDHHAAQLHTLLQEAVTHPEPIRERDAHAESLGV